MRSSFGNIAKSYLYSFLFSFSFSEAIWVLFLAYRGMSLLEIGLLESIFHVTSMCMEIPTGIVADRFGRRNSRILSRAVALLSTLLMISGRTFWHFAAAFVLSALGYNLESGAGDALVYDSLVDEEREWEYMKVKGRLEIAYQGARGLALAIGGFIATFSYELAYALAAGIHGLALITATTFREPMAGRKVRTEDALSLPGLVRHCRASVAVIRASKGLFLYILFIETFSLFYTTLYFYFQNFLKSRGFREGSIGLILALSATASVLAATMTHRIEKRLGRSLLVKFAPPIAIAAFGLIAFTPLEPPAMILLSLVEGILFVSFSDYINCMIPSENRATILSFQAMTFSTMMVVFFPLTGALAQSQGFKTAFQGIFGLSLLTLLGTRRALLRTMAAE